MTEKQSKINVSSILPNENINSKPEFLNPNNNNFKKFQIVDRTEGFTAIDNRIVRGDIGLLSVEAKVILMVLLSLPDDWSLYIDWLNRICKLSKSKSLKARNELINKGFLDVTQVTVNGKIGYKYTVYELPKDIMFKNPMPEIKQRKIENVNQEPETYPINNKEYKEIITKKNYKNDSKNTCITKGNAIGSTHSIKSAKAGEPSIIESIVDIASNMHECFRKNVNYKKAEAETEPSDNLEQTYDEYISDITERINEAEERLNAIENRKKKRETNEKAVIEYINQSKEINDAIKNDLIRFVQMRTEKNIRTTITMFQQLYEDLVAQCRTVDEQKQRIGYAISYGYPTFKQSKSKSYKSSTSPDYVIPEDDEESCVVDDFEL